MPAKEKNVVSGHSQKNSSKYYAFFDAEYTCFMNYDTRFDRRHSNEVISVGLIISDQNFNIKEEYYTPVCPKYNPVLTKYCKELTGLTQSEIFDAPDFEQVFSQIDAILYNYQISNIFVWGNDRVTLEDGIRKNHPFLPKRHKRNIAKVTDITKKLTMKVFGYSMCVSLADMKYICGMKHTTAHNALEDAKDLYRVTKFISRKQYKRNLVENLEKFISQRDEYHRYRRFRKLWPLDEKPRKKSPSFKNASENYIRQLKEFYIRDGESVPAAVLAICDDIRNLAGMDARDCPKLIEK